MTPQDVPVRLRLTLLPEDQQRLAELVDRLGLSPGQILRQALASYQRTLDTSAQLRGSEHARRMIEEEEVLKQELPVSAEVTD